MIILCMTKIFRKTLRQGWIYEITLQQYFYTVINWNSVYIRHGRGLPRFWKVYMYIYWIFCDFIALRYQTWFISSWPRLSWVLWECSYIVNYLYMLFWWACCSPLLSSFITQHQLDKMNMTKLPIRKRLENVPQFSGSVDAAVAEVGATNRLGFQLLMNQTYV